MSLSSVREKKMQQRQHVNQDSDGSCADDQDPDNQDGDSDGGDAHDRDSDCAENVLRQSIQALSSILDAKLVQLMEETDCEVNLGSPQCESFCTNVLMKSLVFI
jgi:hypothetical protein